MRTVYVDNNATTALVPEVLSAMMPYLTEQYGNAASVHAFGHRLMNKIDEARRDVAAIVHGDPKDEITFTSGGTESNNAIIRAALAAFPDRRHILTSSVEHSSVGNVLMDLELSGYEITRVPVDGDGRFNLEAFKKAIRSDTALVTVMWANNETGALFPVEEISRMCREKKVLFHSDAVQAVGKIPIDLRKVPLDYLSISSHKLHGPKGAGVLYARKGAPFTSFMRGGSQQDGRRSGTENVAGIVGTGASCRLMYTHVEEFSKEEGPLDKVKKLRDRFEAGLKKRIDGVRVVSEKVPRLPNTSGILFADISGEALLQLMSDQGIYASSGSACTAGTTEPSHVLLAMGFGEREALGAVRFSLSYLNTEEDIEYILETLPPLVERLRKCAPLR